MPKEMVVTLIGLVFVALEVIALVLVEQPWATYRTWNDRLSLAGMWIGIMGYVFVCVFIVLAALMRQQ